MAKENECNGTQIGDGIVAIAVATAFLGYFYLTANTVDENPSENQTNIQLAKQGLEECPRTLNKTDMNNIWVKDCKSHLLTLNSISK